MSKEWWQENSEAFAAGFTEEKVVHTRRKVDIPHTPIPPQDDFNAALFGIRSRLDQLASINEANILLPGRPQEGYHQIIEEAYAVLGLVETQIDEAFGPSWSITTRGWTRPAMQRWPSPTSSSLVLQL